MLLKKLLRIVNYLSIDVALGAVLCFAAVAQTGLGTQATRGHYVMIFLAVWVIYALDRLADIKSARIGMRLPARHKFVKKHTFPIFTLMLLATLLGLILAIKMLNYYWFAFGLALASLAGLYLFLVFIFGKKSTIWLQKELYAGFIYAAGVCAPILVPLLQFGNSAANVPILLIFASFFVVAVQNLFVFSLLDKAHDYKLGNKSVVQRMGTRKTIRFIYGFALLILVLAVVLFYYTMLGWGFVFIFMSGIHLGLTQNRQIYHRHPAQLRLIGELVFWIPGFTLLF